MSPALHLLVRNHQGGLLRAVSSAAVRGRHPPRKHRLPSRSKSFSLCWGSGEPRREAWGSTLGRGTGGRDQFWLQGPSWGWGDVTAVPPELRSHLPGARGHCPPGWGGGGGAGFQLSWPQRRTGALEVPHRVGPELLGAGPAGKWGLSEVRRGRGVGHRGEACWLREAGNQRWWRSLGWQVRGGSIEATTEQSPVRWARPLRLAAAGVPLGESPARRPRHLCGWSARSPAG